MNAVWIGGDIRSFQAKEIEGSTFQRMEPDAISLHSLRIAALAAAENFMQAGIDASASILLIFWEKMRDAIPAELRIEHGPANASRLTP